MLEAPRVKYDELFLSWTSRKIPFLDIFTVSLDKMIMGQDDQMNHQRINMAARNSKETLSDVIQGYVGFVI